MPSDGFWRVSIPNNFGNMSCLHYLRLEGPIRQKLPYSIVKLKCLETLDIRHSFIRLPDSVWEFKQLRHLLYNGSRQACGGCCSICPFFSNMPPNNLQTLMWMDDKFFEPRLLHGLVNLRKLAISLVSDSTIKKLSTLTPVPTTLEVLKLSFFIESREQINLSSYPNIVKLHLDFCRTMHLINSETFPPNFVKLTLCNFEVDGHVVAVLKKLPKLRILKMVFSNHMEEKMDLSGDSFPQLEVLHIQRPIQLPEVTCRDDVSIPELKKLLLIDGTSKVRLSEHLTKLRI